MSAWAQPMAPPKVLPLGPPVPHSRCRRSTGWHRWCSAARRHGPGSRERTRGCVTAVPPPPPSEMLALPPKTPLCPLLHAPAHPELQNVQEGVVKGSQHPSDVPLVLVHWPQVLLQRVSGDTGSGVTQGGHPGRGDMGQWVAR